MALRELTDRFGTVWKVWDITPDQLHPSSRSGDYLQGFLDGWLVFETIDGAEKRRLYPVPADWQELGDDELAALCERADSVRGGEARPATRRESRAGSRAGSRADVRAADARAADARAADARAADARAADARAADARASDAATARRAARELADVHGRPGARTFLYPGGRVWTVAEQYIQFRDRMGVPIDARTVLRFTSGMRSLDLHAWPSDWMTYSDEGLADLLCRAFPRDREAPTSGDYRRRRSDQPV